MSISAPQEPGCRLQTERLALVSFAPAHLEFLHHLWIDAEVRRFLWDDRVITRDEAAAVIAASQTSFRQHGFGLWVLLLQPDAVPVGFCGLRHFGDPPIEVEILYGLLPGFWGAGLATEAARSVLDHGFEVGLPRIFAGADPPNAASIRVMDRLGMSYHSHRVIQGLDAVYYSIDRDSLETPSKQEIA